MFKSWLPENNLYTTQKKRYFLVPTGEKNAPSLSSVVAFRKAKRINVKNQRKKKKINCRSAVNIHKNIGWQHFNRYSWESSCLQSEKQL